MGAEGRGGEVRRSDGVVVEEDPLTLIKMASEAQVTDKVLPPMMLNQ